MVVLGRGNDWESCFREGGNVLSVVNTAHVLGISSEGCCEDAGPVVQPRVVKPCQARHLHSGPTGSGKH